MSTISMVNCKGTVNSVQTNSNSAATKKKNPAIISNSVSRVSNSQDKFESNNKNISFKGIPVITPDAISVGKSFLTALGIFYLASKLRKKSN